MASKLSFNFYQIGLGVVSITCITLLTLSFLAPLTETMMLSVSTSIYSILRSFCHQVPSHCLWYANSNFGVCSHCFGILVGAASASWFFSVVRQPSKYFDQKVSHAVFLFILSLLPLTADILIDRHRHIMNPHFVRIFSGFIAGGSGIFFICVSLFGFGKYLSNNLLKTSKGGIR